MSLQYHLAKMFVYYMALRKDKNKWGPLQIREIFDTVKATSAVRLEKALIIISNKMIFIYHPNINLTEILQFTII